MVFDTFTKLVLLPIYFIIHHNYIFGFFISILLKNFSYKNLIFELGINEIPVQNYASFI